MDNKKDGEVVLTMEDVLQSQLQLEEEAKYQMEQNVGNDEEKCTYEDGYITQQIFSCKTCQKNGQFTFGFCYGCSLKCHLDHEVFELYTKRNFRCDCGISHSSCTLLPKSSEKNTENQYNHNFHGLYCWCNDMFVFINNIHNILKII